MKYITRVFRVFIILSIALLLTALACRTLALSPTPAPPSKIAPTTAPTLTTAPRLPASQPPASQPPPVETVPPIPTQLDYLPTDLPLITPNNIGDMQPLITFYTESGGPLLAASLAFSPDGRSLALLDEEGSLQVWDLDNLVLEYLYAGGPATYPRVVYSPLGNSFAATGEAEGDEGAYVAVIHYWDLPLSGDPEQIFASPRGVSGLAFSPDGSALAAGIQTGMGGGGGVSIWESATSELRFTLETPDWISDVAFSPDGKVIAGSSYASITLWSPYEQFEISTYEVAAGPVERMVFSPQQDHLGLIAQGVRLLDAVTGEQLYSLDITARDLVFSLDNLLLFVVGEDGLLVYEHNSGVLLAAYPAGDLLAVAISPMGNAVAVVSSDGQVEIWATLEP